MNSNVMHSRVQLETEDFNQLVTEVRETIATDLNISPAIKQQTKFGIVDLWNCRKQMRTASSLRKY